MRALIDLDLGTFVDPVAQGGVWIPSPVTRGDIVNVDVQFLRGGQVVALGDGATGKLQLNTSGLYNAATGLVDVSSFTSSGAGVNSVYTFAVNMASDAMATAFASNPASIALRLDMRIANGSEVIHPHSEITINNSGLNS